MNLSRSESDYEAKQDGANGETKIVIKPNLTTSSWSRLKDPRIVRVSRAFGGKDRHSKVCTVRGLRDRRVRLSVQTAIQLYDLQERLGLNQPSKVVDWLLEAAKNEINELPPLQIPPGIFEQNLQGMMNVSTQEGVKSTNVGGLNWEDYWNTDRSKVIARESSDADARNKQNEDEDHDGNFFDRNPNSANFPGLFNNVVGNSSFLKWDPSNLSLSQFGSYGSANHPHQHDASNSNSVPVPIPSGSSQVLMYHQPPVQTQPYFPNSAEFDPKQQQMDFQMVSSSASSSSNFATPLFTVNQGMRPFHLSMNPKFFSSEDNGGHEPNK